MPKDSFKTQIMKWLKLIFCSILFLTNCSDPCKDVNCGTGTCDDGTCLCETGFEGLNCEIESREKFLGFWTSDDIACDGDEEFISTFVIIPNEDSINAKLINPFNSFTLFIDTEEDKFSIPLQSFDFEDELNFIPLQYAGTGTIVDENTIEITITLSFENQVISICNGIYKR